jgi:sn-glycerol 3-phosphate transport system permease protein
MGRDAALPRGEVTPWIGFGLVIVLVLLWCMPFLWMLVAAFRPDRFGFSAMASLIPDYAPTLNNFLEAWDSADFARYYFNTVVICGGILAVQVVTMSLAAYAFARLKFPGRNVLFYLFLIQLMLVPIVLLVPNLRSVAQLGWRRPP